MPHLQQRTCGRPTATLPATLTENRNALILRHLPQVKLVALRIRERLPPSVSLEDLISAGTLGLIAAIDRYDGDHQAKLATYAEFKIRGAILDTLRHLDWMPRLRRRRAKRVRTAIGQLEQQLGRCPATEEIANYLGLTLDEYHRWNADGSEVHFASLDSPVREGDGRPVRHSILDTSTETPGSQLERAELEESLAAVIRQMPEIDKTILQLYFFEEMTLREIAAVTGLHESRVSQIKSRGLGKLRAALAPAAVKEDKVTRPAA